MSQKCLQTGKSVYGLALDIVLHANKMKMRKEATKVGLGRKITIVNSKKRRVAS